MFLKSLTVLQMSLIILKDKKHLSLIHFTVECPIRVRREDSNYMFLPECGM